MRSSNVSVLVDLYGHLVPGANRQGVDPLPAAGREATPNNEGRNG